MDQQLFGIGLYSAPEASRLTGVSVSNIRRWLWGRVSRTNGRPRRTPPLWDPQPPSVDGARALSFSDLVELRFVLALRRHGFGMSTIRKLHDHAAAAFGQSRPFSTLRFKNEGERLSAELGCREVRPGILARLYEDLDFSQEGAAVRWWPLGREHEVVVDPRRNFGHPVVREKGVSTQILADAYETEGSIPKVARWYDVREDAVRDAVAFHHRTAA